ncbi:MAG TPA: hypothetical protein VHX52_07995 [Steroidobacteraceae bacterium]|jgi:hypothetical protein|nr:hypothetical protein [Steroidobacteraceae bacterium]
MTDTAAHSAGRHVVEDAAIERYRTGRLSHSQVGEALGLDYWQTETFLAPTPTGRRQAAAGNAFLRASAVA